VGLVSAHLVRSDGGADGDEPVRVLEAEVVARGRPGIVDVVARIGERTIHLVLGLREPGGETRFLAGDEDPVLGVFEDDDGLAVAFDALLRRRGGDHPPAPRPRPGGRSRSGPADPPPPSR
jgi:hypothetical protein